MPDDLYDRDFVTWSAEQADKLRRLSQGEQVNDIDWPHVVEEVGDLGKNDTRAVRSLLTRALEHLLRAVAYPSAPEIGGWLREADIFLREAKFAWSPGMDQLIDVAALYAIACRSIRKLGYREGAGQPFPKLCPVLLRDLLPTEPDLIADADELLAKFQPSSEKLRDRMTSDAE